MKQDNSENSVSMSALLGFLLAVIGGFSAWLNLPLFGLSSSLVGELASYSEMANLFRWLFLITILLSAVSSMLQYRLISVQITFVSLSIIVCFIFYGLFQDHQLVVNYMVQSEERIALQGFISKHYWLNINPDHTVTLISEYEFLWERLLLNWNIIGIGCKTALFGTIILLFRNVMNARLPASVFVVSAALFIGGMLMVFTPLVSANFIHNQGDTLLNTGRHRQALEAYDEALRLDPMLEYSSPFLIKASRAYYRLEGEGTVFGGLYLLHTAAREIGGRRVKPELLEKLNQARLTVDNIVLPDDNDTSMQVAVMKQLKKESASVWVRQGLLEYKSDLYTQSLSSFQQALKGDGSNAHVKFFIAHVLAKLNRHSDSLALLKSGLLSVWSKQLRADFLCTIGDVYGQLDKPLLAREAYTSCHDLDTVYNYRAVLSLGGT